MGDEERPQFGYGKADRPLWSPRDRDAESVRRVLRRAGFTEFSERHIDGFAVEGANSSENGPEPFFVAHCGRSTAMVGQYRGVLERAGLEVSVDATDDHLLIVRRSSVGAARPLRSSAARLLLAAKLCAAAVMVAVLMAWLGAGAVRTGAAIGVVALPVAAAALLVARRHQLRRYHDADAARPARSGRPAQRAGDR